MYCPRCANQIVDNQNYCRNCGLKLDVIVDAIQDKPRSPFDFENLKRDLRDLGSSLRAGLEEAHIAIKHTRKLKKNPAPPAPGSPQEWSHEVSKAIWAHQFDKALRKMKVAHSRKYSLQQATLSIFGGGAIMAVWYYLLEAATNQGLFQNLQTIILDKTGIWIDGLIPVIQLLWMFGLIPVARGVAHLINGIFFAPKPEKDPAPQVGFAPDFAPNSAQRHIQPTPAYASAVDDPATNDLKAERTPQMSVTEDPTLRFEPK
ncbi:MAG TPA: zinc ribbon domain-containing protein [Blastocatellia bacterium]|nr:zinc ribbon domain-containing protein [Blastocatellia bacterium]HKE06034.1 zinc ribbon domain-containing protein [Blastocatellia bacterium]